MEASTLQAPVALSRISISAPLLRLRSDEQLVALFRAGSDDAFRAIHDRYQARLLVYARQMLGGCSHDAEDVLQDVFVRAHGALRRSDRPISLRAWLYRVAHNRCIDQLRRPVPEPADVFDISRPPTHDPPLETERREDLRRLVTDVGRLPDQQRSALLMREMQGMSYDEMSAAMDVSVAAIKSLLVRARGGLVDSAHARDAACSAVRRDVALACDRGVRSSGLVRRHLRDCSACREYRDRLRGARRRLAALMPVGPLGVLAQAVGLGGGGAAAVGGSAAGTLGGAGAMFTAAKVALVCAAAVSAGGALQVARRNPGHAAPAVRSQRHTLAGAPRPTATATTPAPEVADVTLRAPATRLATLLLADPATDAPARTTSTHRPHHAASTVIFITGQDSYPPGTGRPATGGSAPPGTSGGAAGTNASGGSSAPGPGGPGSPTTSPNSSTGPGTSAGNGATATGSAGSSPTGSATGQSSTPASAATPSSQGSSGAASGPPASAASASPSSGSGAPGS